MQDIVYHGSNNPNLTELEAGMPPYKGGIGFGVYVAFDRNVAEFYGGHVYKLKLLLSEDDILWLDPYSMEQVPGFEEHSVLVGEQVPPFSFSIKEQRYTVGWDGIEEQVAKNQFRNLLKGTIPDRFIESMGEDRISDAEDLALWIQENGNELAQWAAEIQGIEDWEKALKFFFEDGGSGEVRDDTKFFNVVMQALEKSEKLATEQLGLIIDLEDIGGEAQAAGYKGVYLEGARGGMPNTELLVFNADDLRMLELDEHMNRNNLETLLESLLKEQHEEDYQDQATDLDYVLNEPRRKKIPHEELNAFENEGYHNILAVLKKATRQEIDYWSNWYQYANSHVQQLASKYDVPMEIAAAVTAVLSPNLGWKMNLMSASRVLDNWKHVNGDDSFPHWDKIPAYKTNQRKAKNILETGDVSFVKGPKVTVFYFSLLYPNRVERELVLDGHAINVWRGIKTPLKNMTQPTKAERKAIVHDYRKVADLVGLTPQQLQAVTWFIWKAVKKPPKASGKIPVKEYRTLAGSLVSRLRLELLS